MIEEGIQSEIAFEYGPQDSVRINRLPHPIPYQGSKRLLAPQILAVVSGRRFRRLYEPFAGSAAITLAGAASGVAERFVIADSLVPLTDIWREILTDPYGLAERYEQLWVQQLGNSTRHYAEVREAFNRCSSSAELLYLLARCVKNSPRFNRSGEFNQGPDRRRRGMRPEKMARELGGAHNILVGRTEVRSGDFSETLNDVGSSDLVYMDPPYAGTTYGTDRRYHSGLERERLIALLRSLSEGHIPYLLSYDGRCGNREYGPSLPEAEIGATRLELQAGRSSQSTLSGRAEITVESLYVSWLLL